MGEEKTEEGNLLIRYDAVSMHSPNKQEVFGTGKGDL